MAADRRQPGAVDQEAAVAGMLCEVVVELVDLDGAAHGLEVVFGEGRAHGIEGGRDLVGVVGVGVDERAAGEEDRAGRWRGGMVAADGDGRAKDEGAVVTVHGEAEGGDVDAAEGRAGFDAPRIEGVPEFVDDGAARAGVGAFAFEVGEPHLREGGGPDLALDGGHRRCSREGMAGSAAALMAGEGR